MCVWGSNSQVPLSPTGKKKCQATVNRTAEDLTQAPNYPLEVENKGIGSVRLWNHTGGPAPGWASASRNGPRRGLTGSPGTRPAARTMSAAPGGKPAASRCTISAAWTPSSSTRSGYRWTAGPLLRTWTPKPLPLLSLQAWGPRYWVRHAAAADSPPGVRSATKLAFHCMSRPGWGGMPRDWAPASQRLRLARRLCHPARPPAEPAS